MRIYSLFLWFFLFLSVGNALAQIPKNKEGKTKLKLIAADKLERDPDRFKGNQILTGNVQFDHKGTILTADSAVFYQKENFFVAWSRVRVVEQEKTISADYMEYDGNTTIAKAKGNARFTDPQNTITANEMDYNRTTEIAYARGDVVMINPNQRVETSAIEYNRKTSIAFSNTLTKVTGNDGSVIESSHIVYNTNTKASDFSSDVYITNKDYLIFSKNMSNNQTTGITTFRDQSKITNRKNPTQYIITRNGTFNKTSGEAFLYDRSQVFSEGKMLIGDTIFYNEKSGFGWAKGDILMDDPQEKRFIKGDYAEVYKALDSAFVTKNAYAVKAFEKDSFYVHADTLVAVRRKDSTSLVRAYHQARFYKSNINGKADSLVYNQQNGLLELLKDPIVWSGENQITGDVIYGYTNPKTEKIDSLHVVGAAFAIAKVDSLKDNEFNQVKGRKILAYYLDNQLDYVSVEGNAMGLSYMDEEDPKTKIKDRIGINHSTCGMIEADLVGRELHIVACRIQSNGKLYPEKEFPEELRYLQGFNWRGGERMLHWRDIFLSKPTTTK
ncbi:OstA-like protein [Weeksella virosa]|uniref:OstA-like protein n=1 Tax=Weeksella virosa TaxID=1014 RepID=UPI0025534F1B|nr:OstA-like protein [Weeksella virosa]MDK7374710.1 OstA-like protein [Weeksella virosa]